jgi:hypothetical protein
MTEQEKLEEAKRVAWNAYDKLRVPADAAFKTYQQAATALREFSLYEKAKREVMRDLIKSAGKSIK